MGRQMLMVWSILLGEQILPGKLTGPFGGAEKIERVWCAARQN